MFIYKIRDISREEAKNEIRDYLKSRDKAWLDEIADDLDFAFAVEIIEELEEWRKGRIDKNEIVGKSEGYGGSEGGDSWKCGYYRCEESERGFLRC